MRLKTILAGIAILIGLSACNLGTGETEEPLDVTDPADTQPTITIISPNDGDSFPLDEPLFVEVEARDALGITRAQLFANGQIVRTVTSEAVEGDQFFNRELEFIPRQTGTFTLRVLAFRGTVASEPDEITIEVTEEDDEIVVTSRPTQSDAPTIPNDGVCRALVNTGLNFRREPTTTRDNIITVLPANTLAPVVARLGDNSWWKLSYNATLGWVSAQFTTLYGNCSNVPVENVIINTATPIPTNTPTATPIPTDTPAPTLTPIPGDPDLIVTSIDGELSPLILSGDSEVTEEYAVTISNLGASSTGQFSATLTVDFEGDETEYDLGVVSNLAAGESIVLIQELTFDAEGEYEIQVEADPDSSVDEVSEVNNRGDITVNVTTQP